MWVVYVEVEHIRDLMIGVINQVCRVLLVQMISILAKYDNLLFLIAALMNK